MILTRGENIVLSFEMNASAIVSEEWFLHAVFLGTNQ